MSNSFLDLNGLAHFKEKMDEQTNKQLANKANIDGYYETLAVGIAKNLEGRNDVTDSFMERTTGGDAEVANGAAQLTEVAGKSQVWNQLAKEFTSANWSNNDVHTSASYNNGVCTINYLDNSGYLGGVYCSGEIISGHKYLVRFNYLLSGDTHSSWIYISGFGKVVDASQRVFDTETNVTKVLTATGNAGTIKFIYGYNVDPKQGTTLSISNFNIIDLTLLGIDNLTTVEEVEAWLAENIGLREYYPHNAGTVLNSKMQGIESLGFNLLDPTTGKARIVGAYSDVYGNYYGITGTHGTLTFTSDLGETSEITPDSDGKFLLEEPGWLDVATPGADCAVFLWWDGTQTDYQPYERNTGDLDVTHIYGKLNGTGELVQVFPDGMAGISTAKDVLRIEDGVTVARRRIGKVDLGSLEWTQSVGTTVYRGTVIGARGYNGNSPTYICAKYQSVGGDVSDKQLAFNTNGETVRINDSSYSSAAAFKTAVTGVPLFYELATEQLYTDLVYQGSSLFADGTPVELPVNYRVNNWGIERMIPQNDSDVVTTFPELTCRYSIDAVEQLNTHTDEIEDLYEGLDELDEKKPNKSGSYPDMAVGSAKAIEGNDTKVEDFTFTPIQCADGLAQIKDVRGKSLVWNQLVQNGDFSNGTTGWSAFGASLADSDGVLTWTANENAPTYANLQQWLTVHPIVGHKYLLFFDIKGSESNSVAATIGTSAGGGGFPSLGNYGTSWETKCAIASPTSYTDNAVYIRPYGIAKENFKAYFRNIHLHDLTLMFGAGNEPATVEEFEKMFPLPYYAYNAGSMLNNKTEQIESVGFNQWDEEWEQGTYNTSGQKQNNSNAIRSKNYIPCLGGRQYYFAAGISGGRVCFYDKDEAFISSIQQVAGTVFTTPENASYMTFGIGYSTFPANTLCINLSDPSRNGQYEPYKKDTVELNLPTLTGKLNGEGESVVVFPDGLKSAGTVYDEIVGNKAIKRIGVVDLGSLEWTLDNSIFKCTEVTDYRRPSDNSVAMLNQLNAKGYISKSAGEISTYDKIIAFWGTSYRIGIKDTTYNDAATFKTAMSGVLLYYELATPEEYILDTPIPATFQAYKGGTLKQLPENTSTPTTAPMVMENVYAIDVLSVVQSLPQNYISKESLQAMLASMQSAGLFSAYTMTWDGSKYTFTFTRSDE